MQSIWARFYKTKRNSFESQRDISENVETFIVLLIVYGNASIWARFYKTKRNSFESQRDISENVETFIVLLIVSGNVRH